MFSSRTGKALFRSANFTIKAKAMKAFNLTTSLIEVAGDKLSVIKLGEEGRGRTLFSVSCPEGVKDGDPVAATLAHIKTNGLRTKPVIKRSNDPENGWVARISTNGSYIRGACGNISYDPTQPAPIVIAKGYGAFGDAGRTGNWDDVLVQVMDGTVLRIKPTRADAYYLWFQEDKVSTLTLDELQLLELEVNFEKENRIRL